MPTAAVLELKSISKHFSSATVLKNVDLTVRAGKVTCLLGDNGAGKSTLIKIMSGVYPPSSGRVLVDGERVAFGSPRAAQERGIATVHQDAGAFPLMNVARNFFLGHEPTKGWGPFRRIDHKRARQIALEQLGALGIHGAISADQLAGTMSGGQSQALAIARALFFGARLLILDEPTSALGVKEAGIVLKLIRQANSPFEPAEVRNEILRWWARWLRDRPQIEESAGADDAVVYIQGGMPEWRSFDAWPPRGGAQRWVMSPDATLVPEAVEDTDSGSQAMSSGVIAEYVTDPTVGPLSGLWGVPTSGFGLPLDQHDDDMRSLRCTSGAITADMIIAGSATAEIELASGSTADRIVVKLTDVDPDGRSTLITSGTVARPAGTDQAQISLSPTCYRLRSGHRLRMVISDSDFARLWPAPANGETPRRLRLLAMNLTLPVIPEHEGRTLDPPPVGPQDAAALVVSLPQWHVTRDHIHDGVTVRLREQLTSPLPGGGHLLRSCHEVVATVTKAVPSSAFATADTTVTVEVEGGETINVHVRLHMTGDSLSVAGQVTYGDHTVLDRSWQV